MGTFAEATAVAPGRDGAYRAVLDGGWSVGDKMNGGYLLAVLARAALAELGREYPLAVSGHFLRPPVPGPAEVAVMPLRSGRTVATARVTLAQGGGACLEALVTAGQLDPESKPRWRRESQPGIPPLERCLPASADLPGGVHVGLLDQIEFRMDPATAGWVEGRPGGEMAMRAWVRIADDPLALLLAVDSLPPVSFGLPGNGVGWAPTVQLGAYLRALPAAGWLRCIGRGRLHDGGMFDEEVEVWDDRDRLVAHGIQLAAGNRVQS